MTEVASEFFAVAACCRWPRSEARNEAIRAAIPSSVDWIALERIAVRHRVVGLVFDGLMKCGASVPADTAGRLGATSMSLVRTELAMAREAVRLQAAFDSAGVPCVFLKGVALALLAYGDLGSKQSRDIDLLTTPDSVLEACRLLEALGYVESGSSHSQKERLERLVPYSKDCAFVHPELRVMVELHWRLFDNLHLLSDISARSPSQAVCVGGREIRTLTDRALFVYLCHHGTKHAWNRLKWLADFSAFVSGHAPDEILSFHNTAVEMRVSRSVDTALYLSNRVLRAPIPSEILPDLSKHLMTRLFVKNAYLAMEYGRGEREVEQYSWRWLLTETLRMGLAPGWRYFRSELAVKWNSIDDRTRIHLPLWLSFGYHFIRIPSWLFRILKHLFRR